jgi:acetoin utilization deacetylase AcuC-like enzyme
MIDLKLHIRYKRRTLLNYNSKINTFYREEQAIQKPVGFSKSPMKPFLLMQKIKEMKMDNYLKIHNQFPPFVNSDFELAHTKTYVENFFKGSTPESKSNGLDWSPRLAESVRFTNSSLYHAQTYSLQHPDTICFSPTSGFHHATPRSGGGFCTFSGQAISALKLYNDPELTKMYGSPVVTAWLDLDGHFGNSIGDSYSHNPILKKAIPEIYNINPSGTGASYLENLSQHLDILGAAILENQVQSLCFAQGADSHEDDQLGHQCSTEEWVKAHTLIYQWISNLNKKRGKPIPLTLSLFGGYREDDYNSVLNLHLKNLVSCLQILCGGSMDLQLGESEGNGSKKKITALYTPS